MSIKFVIKFVLSLASFLIPLSLSAYSGQPKEFVSSYEMILNNSGYQHKWLQTVRVKLPNFDPSDFKCGKNRYDHSAFTKLWCKPGGSTCFAQLQFLVGDGSWSKLSRIDISSISEEHSNMSINDVCNANGEIAGKISTIYITTPSEFIGITSNPVDAWVSPVFEDTHLSFNRGASRILEFYP